MKENKHNYSVHTNTKTKILAKANNIDLCMPDTNSVTISLPENVIYPDISGIRIGYEDVNTKKLISNIKDDEDASQLKKYIELGLVKTLCLNQLNKDHKLTTTEHYFFIYEIDESPKYKPTTLKGGPGFGMPINGYYKCTYEVLLADNEHTRRMLFTTKSINIPMCDWITEFVETLSRCTGCHDANGTLLCENDKIVDTTDDTLSGTVIFENNAYPCVAFNKEPNYPHIVLQSIANVNEENTITVILTPDICKHITKYKKQPKESLKTRVIKLLQSDYDDDKLSEELSKLLVNKTTNKHTNSFENMPCEINDTVYIAVPKGLTPDVIISGTHTGLLKGTVTNFLIDNYNARYIQIETKYDIVMYSEKEFKDSVARESFVGHL